MSDTTPIERTIRLTTGDFTEADEPMGLFAAWLDEAGKSEPRDPNAMTLATVDSGGMPNARMMLLKGADERGFVFYTNVDSQKGQELASSGKAALLFHWKSLFRQVRVRGAVERVTPEEADAYFATRPKQSQIGAWASQQSRPLDNRLTFEKAVEAHAAKYAAGTVPRPPNWTGHRVIPTAIEFWHDRPFRLHDRIVFKRASASDAWSKTRLYP